MKSVSENNKKESKLLQSEQIDFDSYSTQIKTVLFQLFNFYNKKLIKIPHFIIYFLHLVQFLQILHFICHKDLTIYSSQGMLINIFTQIMSYTNIEFVLKENQGSTNFMISVIVFLFLMSNVALMVYSYWKICNKENLENKMGNKNNNIKESQNLIKSKNSQKSKVEYVLLNLSVILVLLINTILSIPILTVIFTNFYCIESSRIKYGINGKSCYDGLHVFSLLLSLMSTALYFAIKVPCLIFFYEKNPFRNNILASNQSYDGFFKTGINIAMIWYFIVDTKLEFQPLYMGSVLVLYGWYLFFFRWKKIGYFNKKFMYFVLTLQIQLVCFSINNLLRFFLPSKSSLGIDFVQFIFASFLFSYCLMYVNENLKSKLIETFYEDRQKILKSNQVEHLFVELINFLLYQEDNKKKQLNTKILIKQINKQQSTCSRYYQKQSQFIQLVKQILIKQQSYSEQKYNSVILSYLRILLDQAIDNKSNFLLKACRCALLYDQGLKTKALHDIYSLESDKNSWIDEFFLYQIKSRNFINSQKFMKQSNNIFEQYNQSKVILYDRYICLVQSIQTKITQSINLLKQYWLQLQQEQPQFQYLKRLSTKIQFNHKSILFLHQAINENYQNCAKQKFLYFYYLQAISWSKDHYEGFLDFIEENSQENLQGLNNHGNGYRNSNNRNRKILLQTINQQNFSIDFEENQKIVMIQLDFYTNQGVIKNCSSEIYKFLGYTKKQLLGRKVEKIMPSYLSSIHNKFIQNFINRSESIFKSSQRIIYAVNKEGYLVPGFLTIKILFDQERGLKLMAYIKKLAHEQRTFMIITRQENSEICGISNELSLHLKNSGLLDQIKNEEVSLQMLFPKLKFLEMEVGVMYEFNMRVESGIDQNSSKERNIQVNLRFQKREYQQNTAIRYYFVKFLQKSHPLQMVQYVDTYTNLLLPNPHSYKVIQQFTKNQKKDKGIKINQTCRNKKNYLSKFQVSKYYTCLIGFVLYFFILLGLNTYILQQSIDFQHQISENKDKFYGLNKISKDVANLTISSMGFEYRGYNESELQKLKMQYLRKVQIFQSDLNYFMQYVNQSSSTDSFFNIKSVQNKSQKILDIFGFLGPALWFKNYNPSIVEQSPLSSLAKIIQKTQTTQLLKYSSLILKSNIDTQLSKYNQARSIIRNLQDTKLSFCLLIIFGFIGFFIIVIVTNTKFKISIKCNIKIINTISFKQIDHIIFDLKEYLKNYMTSQLEEYQEYRVKSGSNSRASISIQQWRKEKLKKKKGKGRSDSEISLMENRQRPEGYRYIERIEGGENELFTFQEKKFGDRKKQIAQKEENQRNQAPQDIQGDNQDSKITISIEKINELSPSKKLRFSNSLQFKRSTKFVEKYNSQPQSKAQIQNLQGPDTLSIDMASHNRNSSVNRLKNYKPSDQNVEHRKSSIFSKNRQRQNKKAFQESNKKNISQGNYIKTKLQKQGISQNYQQQKQALLDQQKTSNSSKQKFVSIKYPIKFKSILKTCIVILIFTLTKYLFYEFQKTGQWDLAQYQCSIAKMIKTSTKTLFLGSLIRPYFNKITDVNNGQLISKKMISDQILLLQSYITKNFKQLETNQTVLKSIYQQLTVYIDLVKRYQPNESFGKISSSSSTENELSSGIARLQTNFLTISQRIAFQIQKIDQKISIKIAQLQFIYIVEFIVSLCYIAFVLVLQYWTFIWTLKQDQHISYFFVQIVPLNTISANLNLFKLIKRSR